MVRRVTGWSRGSRQPGQFQRAVTGGKSAPPHTISGSLVASIENPRASSEQTWACLKGQHDRLQPSGKRFALAGTTGCCASPPPAAIGTASGSVGDPARTAARCAENLRTGRGHQPAARPAASPPQRRPVEARPRHAAEQQ